MRKRRPPSAFGYFLAGVVCLLLAVLMAFGAGKVVGPVVLLLLGVPSALLAVRAPTFAVSYGPAGVGYVGLFGSRFHPWSEVREVRVAVLTGAIYSSDVPELVLTSGTTDQLLMLSGQSWGRIRNRRVARLVTELEAARTAAS
ncbi:hypothetical protein [Streptomyces termitum]|uniref:hypothetical protein n=1 Tax=Streptomyces termitum TaxID=67368 RepID=UPI0033A65116